MNLNLPSRDNQRFLVDLFQELELPINIDLTSFLDRKIFFQALLARTRSAGDIDQVCVRFNELVRDTKISNGLVGAMPKLPERFGAGTFAIPPTGRLLELQLYVAWGQAWSLLLGPGQKNLDSMAVAIFSNVLLMYLLDQKISDL